MKCQSLKQIALEADVHRGHRHVAARAPGALGATPGTAAEPALVDDPRHRVQKPAPTTPQQLATVSFQAGRPCRWGTDTETGLNDRRIQGAKGAATYAGTSAHHPAASGREWLSRHACRSVFSGRANIDVFNLDLPTSLPNDPLDPDLHFSRPAPRDSPRIPPRAFVRGLSVCMRSAE
jgi:hypothetical protein